MTKIKLKDLSLLKTLRFNIHYFGFRKGVKMPIYISKHIHFIALKGEVELSSPLKRGMVHLGFDHVERQFNRKTCKGTFYNKGKLVLGKDVELGMGSSIVVLKGAVLKIGDRVFFNAKDSIIASKEITIGSDCAFSWDVSILDDDMHTLIDSETKEIANPKKPVNIGDRCWVGFGSKILKGASFGPDVVVGTGSLISKHFTETHAILGGGQ